MEGDSAYRFTIKAISISGLKEQKKKQVIAWLLLVSCAISGYLLFAYAREAPRTVHSFAQVDSLIETELAKFSIGIRQVEQSAVQVDSTFSRKIYQVSLPPGFSKTQLHAVLNRQFHPLGISTPAQVTFPDNQMQIHLEYRGTIIRTIELQTDPDLTVQRHPASIILALDEQPDSELLSLLTSFGEPIPLAFEVQQPMEANELQKILSGRYNRLCFWLQSKDNEDLIQSNPSMALRKLKQFEEVLPEANILLFGTSSGQRELLSQTDLTYVDARNAFRLYEEAGKATFLEELNKLKSEQSSSVVIISATETTLNWLNQKLPNLKKAGVTFRPPTKLTF